MVYAINVSCYYFAFPEHTSHHRLHPGLNTSFPRVTLNVILKFAIIPICEKHRDKSVHSLLFLNQHQHAASHIKYWSNFWVNKFHHWRKQKAVLGCPLSGPVLSNCAGRSSKALLLPFPSRRVDWQQALLSQLSCVAKSLPCASTWCSTPRCLLPTIPKQHC